MARNWESDFGFWAQPPSRTEEQRSDNAIKGIRSAVNGSSKLNQRKIKVFTQGSYRNRVNVRQDSDVDLGVMIYDSFFEEYPEGKTRADFGNIVGDYPYSQFKDELEEALVDRFGRASVKRGNKAFNIRENTYHVEADVVPLFEFRQYWPGGSYRAGVSSASFPTRPSSSATGAPWCANRGGSPFTTPPACSSPFPNRTARGCAPRWGC